MKLTDVLKVEHVSKSFSGLKAVDDFSAEISDSEICGIVGPNGAGKTTLINLISGMIQPDNGSIYFNGERIDHLKPHKIVRKGIVRSFQVPKPFRRMTVVENLSVPSIAVHGMVQPRVIDEILDLIDLKKLAQKPAGSLSGGEQKLLGIGCALSLKPKLLLLDEPTAAVHPKLRGKIADLLLSVKATSIIVVSHDMNFVTKVSRRLIVMNAGKKLVEGGADVLKDARVVEAYLGV